VTAAAREQDRQRALEAGFDAHVAKPVDRAGLMTVIHAVTHRHRETS
jgi:CheY-like chemotaxis protein